MEAAAENEVRPKTSSNARPFTGQKPREGISKDILLDKLTSLMDKEEAKSMVQEMLHQVRFQDGKEHYIVLLQVLLFMKLLLRTYNQKCVELLPFFFFF